jgi:hypothetical protein
MDKIAPMTQEAWKPESPKSGRRSIIREFALTTSAHGLPSIARSQTKHNCILWIIACLVFTGIMLSFIIQSIQAYFGYPTQTSVSIVVERSQAFPAVTFCNYAPARFDRVIVPFLNYTNSLNLTNTNDTSITAFTPELAVMLREFLQKQFNAGDAINEYFFSINIMLMSCSYNGQTCTADDFISFLSSTYGRCYTFNAKTKTTNGSDVRYTTDNGGPGRLELLLYAQNQLYVPYIQNGLFQ